MVSCVVALVACSPDVTTDETSATVPGSDAGADTGVGGSTTSNYERLFPKDYIIDIDLSLSTADWALLMQDPLKDVYVPATLTFDGIVVSEVGMRLKGNSSRHSVAEAGGVRYSFKVDIDRFVVGQELLGIDKFNLNNSYHDPTYMRERLALGLFGEKSVIAPRHGYGRLSINGQLFGLYAVVEQVDKEFLRAHFSDDSGNLYKPELQSGNLLWHGSDITAYPDINLKTNEDAPDHSGLLHFIDVLNNTPLEQLPTALSEVFDVDAFLQWLAINTALVLLDSYAGSPHNYYLYEDPSTGRFVYIPWDTNGAYGVHSCGGPGHLEPQEKLDLDHLEPICGPASERPLIMRLLDIPSYRAIYRAHLADLLADLWSLSTVTAQITEVAALIRDDVAADPNTFYSIAEFETNLHNDVIDGHKTIFGLTRFTEYRVTELASQGIGAN